MKFNFKEGETVIFRPGGKMPDELRLLDGHEVTVLGINAINSLITDSPCYLIDLPNALLICAETYLEKMEKSSKPVEWDECLWQPEK